MNIFVKINYPDLIYIASLCAFLGIKIWIHNGKKAHKDS